MVSDYLLKKTNPCFDLPGVVEDSSQINLETIKQIEETIFEGNDIEVEEKKPIIDNIEEEKKSITEDDAIVAEGKGSAVKEEIVNLPNIK